MRWVALALVVVMIVVWGLWMLDASGVIEVFGMGPAGGYEEW